MALMAGSASAAPQVQGFIVQLQGAAQHLRTVPGMSGAQDANALATSQRWSRVLESTALAREAGVSLHPVGRAAQRLQWPRPLSAAEQASWQAALAAQPEVAWVVPDTREQLLQSQPAPDDPLFSGASPQWWLQPVSGSNGLPLAARLRGVAGVQTGWARSTGAPEVVIAVLDTGITAHPDLPASRLLPGYDLVSDWDSGSGRGYANDGDGRDADPTDPGDWVSAADQQADASRFGECSSRASSWHGTTVTGMLAAGSNNALGVAGLDWAAKVVPVRVSGKCGATVSDIVDGMRWAAGLSVCRRWANSQDATAGCAEWAPINPNPARLINISFGAAAECNAAYQSAIDELWTRGVLVVAAGGNDHAAPSRPANCSHVLGVAALNRDGFKASYSNFGAALRLAAVGGDDSGGRWGALLSDGGLLTLGNEGLEQAGAGLYNRHTGTSFAAPMVTGVAAQMLALSPGLGADTLLQGLTASARPHVRSSLMAARSSQNPGRCLCTTTTCGAGLLDADEALRYAQLHALGQSYQAPNWPVVEIDTPELQQAVALGPDREAPAAVVPPSEEVPASGGGALSGSAGWLLGLIALGAWVRRPLRRRSGA